MPAVTDNNRAPEKSSAVPIPKILEIEKPVPKLAVGAKVYLRILGEKDAADFEVTVRGWVDEAYFIVDTPALRGNDVGCPKGGLLTVRYALEGTVYAFQSRFARSILAPSHLWCLEFPELMETRALRRNARIRTVIPIEIEGAKERGFLIDISAGGALIEIQGEITATPGSELKLGFRLPGSDTSSWVNVRAKNFVASEHAIGVSFRPEDLVDGSPMCALLDWLGVKHGSRSTPRG